jgi:hypothetical protein
MDMIPLATGGYIGAVLSCSTGSDRYALELLYKRHLTRPLELEYRQVLHTLGKDLARHSSRVGTYLLEVINSDIQLIASYKYKNPAWSPGIDALHILDSVWRTKINISCAKPQTVSISLKTGDVIEAARRMEVLRLIHDVVFQPWSPWRKL